MNPTRCESGVLGFAKNAYPNLRATSHLTNHNPPSLTGNNSLVQHGLNLPQYKLRQLKPIWPVLVVIISHFLLRFVIIWV